MVVLPGAGESAALGMTIEKRQEAEQKMPLCAVYRTIGECQNNEACITPAQDVSATNSST